MFQNVISWRKSVPFWGILFLLAACTSSTPVSPLATTPAQTSPPAAPTLPATAPATSEPVLPTPLVTDTETPVPASPSSPNAAFDACALITPAEAQEALKKEVGEPDRTPQGPAGDWCTYQAAGASDTAVIGVETGVSAANFKEKAEQEAGMAVTPVPGLGDEAYSMLSVYVRKGDTMLIVSLDAGGYTTLQERIDATVQLAQKAVTRLP